MPPALPLPSANLDQPIIRVLVVDDHPPMRIGLVGLIGSQPGMEVIGEASNGDHQSVKSAGSHD